MKNFWWYLYANLKKLIEPKLYLKFKFKLLMNCESDKIVNSDFIKSLNSKFIGVEN